ncbi:leucine-rich repeat domain-containing protein [Psychroserpens sp. AS72]|uniref:leucine-rich repeat domain-containing protein n=1 Tax=Psychroserpens sp. AS72 TaxID=3135775 RepID=UPI00317834B6
MKKQLLILMTLLITIIGYSQTIGDTFVDNFITYQVTSIAPDTVEAIDYNIAGGSVVNVPASVSYSTVAFDVTNIGIAAFLQKGLTSVEISNSVTSIESAAFFGNLNLTSVTLQNGIVSIGNNAFSDCDLTNLIIPSTVTNIGHFAFNNNNQLTCIVSEATTPPIIIPDDSFGNHTNIDLSIPTGTTSAYATAQWTGFNSVAAGLTGVFEVDNITYQINATPNSEVTITNYNTAGGTDVDIPPTVTSACTEYSVVSIGNSAFFNSGITSVTIPNSVLAIGDTAFVSTNLQTVTIPDSVLTIGIGAFAGINYLNSVVLGNNVTNIEAAAFRYAPLTIITIPNSVTNIGTNAFSDNPLLTDVYSENTTPPTITDDTFTSFANRSNIHLHIPPGTLDVYVTNPNPGADWTGFNPVTLDATLSTSNFEFANDIIVVSNPNALKVISSDSVRLENYAIYSITGAKVATGAESEISTSFLANGIYVLKLNFDKGTFIKRFVK